LTRSGKLVRSNGSAPITAFERVQTAAAQQSQFETTVKSSVQQEASAYDDPQAAALARGARKHSIELYGQAQGWSSEQIAQAITSADLNAMEQRAQNYAVSNPQGGSQVIFL
jgi:hypothetical protein